MKKILVATAFLGLAACSPKPAADKPEAPAAVAPTKPAPITIPAGAYTLDKPHSTIVFRVSHLGFSNYTAAFADFDAKLNLDPAKPELSTLEVTVDPRSLTLQAPPAGFKEELTGPHWLDAGQYPAITFKSTKVDVTGPNTAKVTGDFTLHGVTKPLTLETTFNGGYAGHPMDPHARAGFSATGTFKRSDFGMAYGVPAPGTTMGVSDEVAVTIETEFSGPPLAAAPAPPPAG